VLARFDDEIRSPSDVISREGEKSTVDGAR